MVDVNAQEPIEKVQEAIVRSAAGVQEQFAPQLIDLPAIQLPALPPAPPSRR